MPAWFAFTVQVPTCWWVISPATIEQFAAVLASIASTTALPDAPPVAVGV
ncbi:hypothetical protein [Nocardioides marmoriginsengisoli]|nr:hypothetical protein [Nocardioides marmoriginsengisoli]